MCEYIMKEKAVIIKMSYILCVYLIIICEINFLVYFNFNDILIKIG